jgi:hypothetical protein
MTTHRWEEPGMNGTDQAQVPNSARTGQTTTPVRQLLQAAGWRPAQIESPTTRWTVNVLAWAGAILVLLSGLVHLKLFGSYKGISVIGPLFLAQGIVGILLAVALAVFRRMWLILGGAGFLVATAAGLLISVNFGLFGFQDSLAVPYATSSMVEEFIGGGVLVVAAIAFLAGRPWRGQGSERVWPPKS